MTKIIPFEEVPNVREVPSKRRYWFVRTFGGKLFDYYYEREKVGIIGNSVPLQYIKNALHDDVTFTTLQHYILNNIIDKQSEATKLANQLIRFYHEVNIGDIVMMPSTDSDYIAFGKVTSSLKIEKTAGTLVHNDKVEPFPEKVRKVEWLKIMQKSDVVGDLRPLFSSHLGLTNADKYGDFIESNLSSFFIKDDQYFSTLCIDLNEDQELNAFDLQRYLESLTKLYHHYCVENGIECNEELFLKIKVQSSGNLIIKWGEKIKTASRKTLSGSIIALIGMSIAGSDPELSLQKDNDGTLDFKVGLKGNIFKNLVEYESGKEGIQSKKITDSLDAEGVKIDQLIKRKENGLLTPEERALYEHQLVDSAKALKISSVESKEVQFKEIEDSKKR